LGKQLGESKNLLALFSLFRCKNRSAKAEVFLNSVSLAFRHNFIEDYQDKVKIEM